MKDKYSVYLAGPITGLMYNDATDWRENVIRSFPEYMVGYSPMRAKSYLSQETNLGHSYENYLFSSQRGIFARDMHDCLNCDALLVNFLGATKVSIGTVMEIQSFWMRRKPIVLVMEPENNPHDHSMIKEACPFWVHTLQEAVLSLEIILTPVGHYHP